MERSQRIGRINALMRRPQGVTMAQLQDDMEVSRATINRDLQLMRDQMHAPIVWDEQSRCYRLDTQHRDGPAYMLPGLWFSPAQAYAYLTMQNMVEKIAPNLLGPFLHPIRSMLKQMLGEADFPLYGLDRKIEIDMPAMPNLNDLDFSNLLDALVHEQPVRLIFTIPGGREKTLTGMPVKLKITASDWSVQIQTEAAAEPLVINVAQIRKVVAGDESPESPLPLSRES
jgi:predicted DNA-binding transcriptional regulator YafY